MVDNVDSFVHNLGRYLLRLGLRIDVLRRNDPRLAAVDPEAYSALVLSPGPGRPEDAPEACEVTRRFWGRRPILGICLGHQIVAVVNGGKITRCADPYHGRASWIEHDTRREFAGLPNPLQVGRYHSLVVDAGELRDSFVISAWSRDDPNTIMAIRHRTLPICGFQFHPESLLTPQGFSLLHNFFKLCGFRLSAEVSFASEIREKQRPGASDVRSQECRLTMPAKRT
ncbi:MAG: aminodeoxychorismate/anthranilate synthase component II [Planctomycetota bacterium]|nr:MAG: aminodeoxychorismate/anthranilate synthase component II [Planctomycetota bacterium]